MIAVLFGLALSAWAVLEGAWTSPETPERGTLALPTGLVLLAANAASVVEHFAWAREGIPAAAPLLVGGIAIRLWAIRTLGDAFGTALAPKRVVRTGLYRWLRHPSEIGLVLAAVGGAILLGSAIGLVCAALLVPLSIVRCQREDLAMRTGAVPASDAVSSAVSH